MEQAVAVLPDGIEIRQIYSGRRERLTGFDSVVLSCGGEADSALHDALVGTRPEVHLLGDAYAPRRLVFATRQAYALARLLAAPAAAPRSAALAS